MYFPLRRMSARAYILFFCALCNLALWPLVLFMDRTWMWLAIPALTLLTKAVINTLQAQHSILRNYPIVGYIRYMLEAVRPEMRQYFFESDIDGKPFSRRQRNLIYQRAKGVRESVAFGTPHDVTRQGYEWAAHAMFPKRFVGPMQVTIGNRQCSQPYELSILNVGAMSYGALSSAAISALNQGASIGGFAHNTGEGGISPYHLLGGDLIWQIGTGYFGCRDAFGKFDAALFKRKAANKSIKMIELKLSQGAKPGLGGILPANKNTPEIAAIRHVAPATLVASPPSHSAFSNVTEMIRFVGFLRSLSGGKPVGIKLCLGSRSDFTAICEAIYATNIIPDFMTIDGAEGGTGAAPVEFTDFVGMPLHEALAFAAQTLEDFQLDRSVKIIASGKITNAFDLIKALSLGASSCYSARGMMFAMGCIQALECNSDKCPVGIATHDKARVKGLVVSDKRVRVANYHKNTIDATVKLMEACGFEKLADIDPSKIFRKSGDDHSRSLLEIYFPKKSNVNKLFKIRSIN